jgi:hypothetical protein
VRIKSNGWILSALKLPVFIFTACLCGPIPVFKKTMGMAGFYFHALVTAGTIWSMFHYVTNMTAVHEEYLRAKNNDHTCIK